MPAFLIKPIQRITKYPLLLEASILAYNCWSLDVDFLFNLQFLFEQELKRRVSPETYPHYQDLEAGILAAKRIADRINEAERKSQNYMTCKALQKRVVDWKGHHISGFGPLRLDDLFTVNKSDVDRDYHVFLFDRIILCCKEAVPPEGGDRNSVGGKKGNKSNSLLSKKNSAANSALPPVSLGASAKKRTTPLLLKGRIFLSNVTKAQAQIDKNEGRYGLEVWWRGDEDLEFFTLRCRTEEQMRMWETNVNQLVQLEQQKQKAEKALRAAERERNGVAGGRSSSSASLASRPSMSSMHMHSHDGTIRHAQQQYPPVPQYAVSHTQRQHYSHGPSSSRERLHQQHPPPPMSAGPHARGPSVSSSHNGARTKDLTKYFGASQIPMIAPPVSAAGARFGGSPAREYLDDDEDYDDLEYSPTREDQTVLPRRTQRAAASDFGNNDRGPVYPRSTSALGGRITPGAGPQQRQQQQQQQPPQRPALRSQFSSVRLGDVYSEQEQDAHEIALARVRAATTGGLPHRGAPSPSLGVQQQRTRATSTPAQAHASAAVQRHNAAPPLPQQSHLSGRHLTKSSTTMSTASTMATSMTGRYAWSATASQSSLADMTSVTTATTTEEKRGSGSSQFSGASHGESSGYSTNDQGSPLTPYGSSDSNTGSVLTQNKGMVASVTTPTPGFGHQRYGSMSSQQVPMTVAGLPPMKIKVHYRQDLFIIAVSRDITYEDLADRVGKKIRLCGGDRAPDAPLRIKYRDDDGDLISIGSEEDVQMAFDTELPMIALWVQ